MAPQEVYVSPLGKPLSLLKTHNQHNPGAPGIQSSQMQERTGIDSANLSRLENGLVPNPTVETLARYAEALNRELVLSLHEPLATSSP